MKTNEELKSMVREKYGEIAMQDAPNKQTSCCGVECCSE